ncbi:MAG: hypothetical protein D6717_00480 [Gammaproteobacteria bacterium]|nr:MAG: hypothetical protein D6717_00480 [Gammaproteobacteria bacterium]
MSLALGLGDIRVKSALNEPLDAEIDVISASPDDVIDIVARLADRAAFERAGVDRSYVLTKLKFTPAVENGKPVIRVTTREPVKEPFLDFLVDVNWPKGRLLREYTILLDPPLLMERRAVATQAPVVAPAEAEQPAAAAATAPAPAPAPVAQAAPEPEPAPAAAPQPEVQAQAEPAPAPQPEAAPEVIEPQPETVAAAEQTGPEELFPMIPIGAESSMSYGEMPAAEEYKVKANDTLWEIANRMKPEGVTVNQMMIALLQANPDAFIRNNINNLKKGVILRMPPPEVLAAIDRAQANAEVKQQYALWKEYRQQVAGKAIPQEAVPAAGQAAQPAEAAADESRQAAAEAPAEKPAGAELEILAPEAPAAESGKPMQVAGGEDVSRLQHDLALAREQIESSRRENAELKSRLDQLEQMLKKQERLLNLKDEELNELRMRLQQQEGGAATPGEAEQPAAGAAPEAGAPEAPAATETAEAPSQTAPSAVEPIALEPVAPAEGEMTAQAPAQESPEAATEATSEVPETEAPAAEAEQAAPAEPVLPAIEEGETVPGSVAEVKEQPEPEPEVIEPVKKPELVTPQPAQPGFIERLLSDTRMLAIGGGGIAVVLLLLLLLLRRKGKGKGKEKAAEASRHVTPAPQPEPEAEPEPETEPPAAEESVEPAEEAAAGEEAVEEAETDKTMVLERPPQEADIEIAAPEAGTEDTIATEAGEEDIVVDDTISEADVFLAYGLYGQAEELLEGAIKEHPERNDYRVKLLETHFAAKEQDKFLELAKELHERTGGKGKLWERAVVMGKELIPDEPLFAEAQVEGVSLEDIVHEKPEAADIDLSGEELGDFDLGEVDLEAPVEAEAEETSVQPGMATTQVLNPDVTVDEEAEAEAEKVAGDEAMDFDLGGHAESLTPEESADTASFEVDDLGIAEESAKEESETETILDMDIPELEELETVPETEQMDISDLDLEAFEEEEDEAVAEKQAEEEEELELDEIELDLGDETGETEIMPEEAELVDLEEELDLDEDLEEVDAEQAISTKLDLAKAYIDMGDSEGAKSTLEEVLAEGNEEQKKEAQALLDQID